jgi:hypothetical protein
MGYAYRDLTRRKGAGPQAILDVVRTLRVRGEVMLKRISALATVLLLSSLTPPCEGQGADRSLPPPDGELLLVQEDPEWRSVWDITLSTDSDSGLPSTLQLVLRNRGEETLRGKNLAFSIYLEDSIYGWGIDKSLHAEQIAIPPESSIRRVIRFDDLEFKDYKGNEIPPAIAREELSRTKWHISAALMDLHTPKPIIESSLSVFSNSVTFEPGPAK